MNNIRSFREDPVLINKIGVAIAYLVLGGVVARHNYLDYGGLLSLFMILGIIMWIFVIQKRTIKYFIRYHLTQALLLNVALSATLWLLIATVSLFATLPLIQIIMGWIMAILFQSIPALFHASPTPILPFSPFTELATASVKDLIIMTIAIYLAVTSFRGQYTELPYITDGVRHWL